MNTDNRSAAAAKFFRSILAWLKENFLMDSKQAGHIAMDGLIRQNPVFVLLLGLCPALAVTTSLRGGISMGLITTTVLFCSSLVISLLRKVLSRCVRTAACLVVIAAFVTMADLLLQAHAPDLSHGFGLYIPLMVSNCILLEHVETVACQNTPGKALLDGLCTGLGFTCALAILGAIREVLGAGTLWGVPVSLFSRHPAALILSPCGGFIILGCLVALVQFIRRFEKTGKGGGAA